MVKTTQQNPQTRTLSTPHGSSCRFSPFLNFVGLKNFPSPATPLLEQQKL